jgi:hypothetical protein
MTENFLISENLNLSPDLQVKKKFNWFKFLFNAIWISFLVVMFLLASRNLFAYWQVYRSIPVNEVEFFAIFDKRSYQANENWQNLVNQLVPQALAIEPALWTELLTFDQYYWAIYWENSADIKAKVIIYSYAPLPQDLLDFLNLVKIPYVYNDKVLLLNSDNLQIRDRAVPDLLMFNNICVGRWQNQSFNCDSGRTAVKVTLADSDLRPVEKANVFNIDNLENRLLYANNQLELSEISQFLPETAKALLAGLDKQELSLLVFNSEHSLFSQNWAMFLPQIESGVVLAQLQYQLAYQNRQIRVNPLADGSSYEDELLDYQIFSWTDENFNTYDLKKLPLDQDAKNFLYAYPFEKNLILSTDKNLFQAENLFLEKTGDLVQTFSPRKILTTRSLFSEFLPWQVSSEWCPILKIEEKISNRIFTLCD